ncbi:MAG: DUF2510 domain-containing protein [Aeromicrobium sp.]|uniref:DUF2510 domain-containing protein n=1 Tax=Aeromicrobium sp. TaxID=1871063 RepID=UPI0039E4430B
MTDSTQPVAGWYPDGQGGQRWWDGAQWTEHTQAAEPAAAQLPGAPTAGAASGSAAPKLTRQQVILIMRITCGAVCGVLLLLYVIDTVVFLTRLDGELVVTNIAGVGLGAVQIALMAYGALAAWRGQFFQLKKVPYAVLAVGLIDMVIYLPALTIGVWIDGARQGIDVGRYAYDLLVSEEVLGWFRGFLPYTALFVVIPLSIGLAVWTGLYARKLPVWEKSGGKVPSWTRSLRSGLTYYVASQGQVYGPYEASDIWRQVRAKTLPDDAHLTFDDIPWFPPSELPEVMKGKYL